MRPLLVLLTLCAACAPASNLQDSGDTGADGMEAQAEGKAVLSESNLKARLFCPQPVTAACKATASALSTTQAYLAGTTNPTPDGKHAGIDIGGTNTVYSPVAGTVKAASSVCGKVVIADSRDSTDRHVFLHMKSIAVASGTVVAVGTKLGVSSNVTGGGCVANGSHLHYEIRDGYTGTSAVGTTSGTSTEALTHDPLAFSFP